MTLKALSNNSYSAVEFEQTVIVSQYAIWIKVFQIVAIAPKCSG